MCKGNGKRGEETNDGGKNHVMWFVFQVLQHMVTMSFNNTYQIIYIFNISTFKIIYVCNITNVVVRKER